MENTPARLGFVSELLEKGSEEASDVTLGSIPKIEVIECNQGGPILSHTRHVLDDSRAIDDVRSCMTSHEIAYQSALFPEPATKPLKQLANI
jgi:hypothetical protein